MNLINVPQGSSQHSPNVNAAKVKYAGYSAGTQEAPGAQQDLSQACAEWIEQNYSYYEAIRNGTSPYTPAQQALIMDQFRYAFQTAYGSAPLDSGWGDNISTDGSVMAGRQGNLPEGAKFGPRGEIYYNQGSGTFTYTQGLPNTIHVFSDEFTLNVSVKAKVDVTKTMDESLQPPEEVYKVRIQDPASLPAETILMISKDTRVNLNTLAGKNVTFHDDAEKSLLEDGKPRFVVGTYDGEAMSGDGAQGPEASMKGSADPKDPSILTYKPDFEGETVDFHALPGTNQTHVVYANANIACKPGDQADVHLDTATGDLTVKVTHDDGSTDTYVIKKGYQANVNINKEYITFDGKAPEGGKVPTAFKDRIQVPQLASGSSAGTVDTGKGPEADANMKTFLDAFQDPPVTYEEVQKAGLVDEIAYGRTKPSNELINFLFQHDNALKSHQGEIDLLCQRLAQFLNKFGYQAEAGKQIKNENDIFAAHLNNLTINGTTYNVWPNNLNDWGQGFDLRPVSIRTED